MHVVGTKYVLTGLICWMGFRVARLVCEGGLPSRTDFWVLDKAEVDFTSEVAPSELVPDISSLETRLDPVPRSMCTCHMHVLYWLLQQLGLLTIDATCGARFADRPLPSPGRRAFCAAHRAQGGHIRYACI